MVERRGCDFKQSHSNKLLYENRHNYFWNNGRGSRVKKEDSLISMVLYLSNNNDKNEFYISFHVQQIKISVPISFH